MANYIKQAEAAKILDVHYQTLHKWCNSGKIEYTRTPAGHRLYNVEKYLEDNYPKKIIEDVEKKNVCYCRVSTVAQRSDLKRQMDFMLEKYPEYEMITDVGSGINFKRKGLQKIIRYAFEGKLENLAIAYKDRLCRIGYDLIEHILKEYSNTNIIIENDVKSSPEEDVVNDLVQIITVFGARIHGLRSYSRKIKNDEKVCKKGEKCKND
jgi:predicted site-specific integrase-resolvase